MTVSSESIVSRITSSCSIKKGLASYGIKSGHIQKYYRRRRVYINTCILSKNRREEKEKNKPFGSPNP
jgi:hypothetical protein